MCIALEKLKIDDPVGAFPVHGVNGIWGTLSIGLFGQSALGLSRDGLFYGGGLAQLGVQLLGCRDGSDFHCRNDGKHIQDDRQDYRTPRLP